MLKSIPITVNVSDAKEFRYVLNALEDFLLDISERGVATQHDTSVVRLRNATERLFEKQGFPLDTAADEKGNDA